MNHLKSTGDFRYTRFRLTAVLFQCYVEHQYPIRGHVLKNIAFVESSPGLSGNVNSDATLTSSGDCRAFLVARGD